MQRFALLAACNTWINPSSSCDSSSRSRSAECQPTSSSVRPEPGQRIYPDGPGLQAYRLNAPTSVLAAVTLTVYVWLVGVLIALLFVGVLLKSPYIFYLLLAIVSTVFWPNELLAWPEFRSSSLMRCWRQYFSFSLAFEEHLDPSKTMIFASYPHGAFPISQLLGLSAAHVCYSGWRGELYGLAASSVFRIPLWRHVMSCGLGVRPANMAVLRDTLKHGSVGVTPGGIAEMYMDDPEAEHIYLRHRKGFVRAAVETGASIVPQYHFGASQLLTFGPKWLQHLGRRCRVSVGLLFGAYGLPVPRQRPLFMVSGRAIDVPQLPRSHPAFDATVDEVHERYMRELGELYKRYRGVYCQSWAHRPLIMH